jgi:hypothetical protein
VLSTEGMQTFEVVVEKDYAGVRNSFAGTADSTSARTSALGERGRGGPKRHAIKQDRDGKKKQWELVRDCATSLASIGCGARE